MEMELEKDFNPFYDSMFMISLENNEPFGRRYLVELWYEELIRLRNEIDYIIRGWHQPRVAMSFGDAENNGATK